ncbi:MAG: SAV_2336 N-terminal domain-related protein, partial [Phormidesmis sp.]
MQPSANAIPEAAGLAVLIARLQSAGVDWDGENVADLLWLANYIDPPASNDDFNGAPQEGRDSVRIEIDDSAPAPLPEMSPTLSLSMPQPSRPEKAAASKPRRGIPFQTPTAPALRNRLEIGRSLRPLMRKVDSYTRQVLDESATAELTAQQQFCIPVMRPERERWLELALVIEDSASSFLWREVIRDFRQVLERQGAFRTVTTWYLQTTAANDLHLLAQRPQGGVTPRSRSPKELLESSGRRLIFFISDCISPAWQQGVLQENYLALWAKHGPVAIVQMLPARLWHRTALAEGDRVPFFARSPGVPNAQLLSPALSEDTPADPGLKLPIIMVEPASMAQWARLLAGFGDASAAGVWFESDWQAQVEALESVMASSAAESAEVTPASSEDVAAAAAQLVSRFSKTASDTARELAALMTLVPVDLSLVYIIQTKLLPDSTPLHVAEVFLSGLVERVKDNDAETDLEPETGGSFFATRRRYDFVPGVRDILTDIVEIPSAERVLNEISVYICARLNRSSRNFTALLRLGDELDAEGEEFAEFARVTKQALRRLGGEYAALVDDIEQVQKLDVSTMQVTFPPLETLTFDKGKLVDESTLDTSIKDSYVAPAPFPPVLLTKEFTVLTLANSSQLPEPIDSSSMREIYVYLLQQYENDQLSGLRDLITDALAQRLEDFDVEPEYSSDFMCEQDGVEITIDDFDFKSPASNDSNLFTITDFNHDTLVVVSETTVNV